jgi:hypothetical protein
MRTHYTTLSQKRSAHSSLVNGDLKILLADDVAEVVAYGRKTGSQGSIVLVNDSNSSRTVTVPVAGYFPNGVVFNTSYAVGNPGGGSFTVSNGAIQVSLNATSGLLIATPNGVDLTPPAAPAGLQVTNEGNGEVTISWSAVAGAAGYNVYRSPVSAGGWVKVNNAPLAGTSYTDTGLHNARTYYYTVHALDGPGNESGPSNEVAALPHYTIGWSNLQWPPTMNHTISVVDRTDNVYGQVWIDGVTNQSGPTEGLLAQLGYGPDGSQPASNAAWSWVDAAFNVDAGNNDEFVASLLPEQVGTFDYAYRYSTTNGRDWVYADLDGSPNGYSPSQAGSLSVTSSGDTTPPPVPTGLHVVSGSPAGIELAWDPVVGDPSLYGYELLRGDAAGGPFTLLARITGTSYNDTAVNQGATYFYVVRSIDYSFNRSANSSPVEGTAELRLVTLTFNVTVPATTDGTGRSVYIAGTLQRLEPPGPEWNPSGVVLTRVDATHWTITLHGRETTQIEYKFTLGDWEHVEKDAACGEIPNRLLTLSYGTNGQQTVNDTVQNWRNVAPCGN